MRRAVAGAGPRGRCAGLGGEHRSRGRTAGADGLDAGDAGVAAGLHAPPAPPRSSSGPAGRRCRPLRVSTSACSSRTCVLAGGERRVRSEARVSSRWTELTFSVCRTLSRTARLVRSWSASVLLLGERGAQTVKVGCARVGRGGAGASVTVGVAGGWRQRRGLAGPAGPASRATGSATTPATSNAEPPPI